MKIRAEMEVITNLWFSALTQRMSPGRESPKVFHHGMMHWCRQKDSETCGVAS
jgi:hypothetical protein